MEKASQGESILLPQSQRYLFNNNQIQYNPISSSRRNSSDIDFSDVFGGPPRRVSIQETRYSFDELRSTNHDQSDDDDHNEDSNFAEKPVFGDELSGVNKRRYHNEDFFDDIFKGKDYSLSSSPRKLDRELLSSSPGSIVLSPVRPLPPKADSFVGSSFPAQFSLPARLIKGTDLPAFGSGSRNHYKNKDGVSNGSSNYCFSPLSRISNQGNQVQEGLENNVYHLSRQVSISSSEESFDLAKPNEKFLGDPPKQESHELSNMRRLERQQSASDSDCSEVQNKENQFHFSIYKWAGKGVPLALPFRGGRRLGLGKGKLERASSYNAWINGDGLLKRTPKVTPHDPDFPSCNRNLSSPSTSLTVEANEVKDGSFADISLAGAEEQCHSIVPKSEPESSSSHPVIAEDDVSNILAEHTKEPGANVVAEALPVVAVEYPKKGVKQLRSLLFDNDHEPAVDKAVKNEEHQGNKVKSDKKSSAVFKVGEGVKKGSDTSTIVGNEEADKANIEKNKVGGKVKEFIKIFNQEVPYKAKRKETGKLRTQDAPNTTSTIVDEKLHSMNKNNKTEASIVAEEYLKKSEKQPPEARPNNNASTNFTPASKRSATPNVEQTSESARAGLESPLGDPDEFFHTNFLVEELRHEDDKLPQLNPNRNGLQAIDDNLRNWSRGKEGNIRSLLSTLQYVLWPESGWKPVPLMDIIEGNAVRRYYQKALLCLHPDKLQQKGATSHQKYIAEKVFDILQEAWNHFNSLGSV